jgi:hypothetical protein
MASGDRIFRGARAQFFGRELRHSPVFHRDAYHQKTRRSPCERAGGGADGEKGGRLLGREGAVGFGREVEKERAVFRDRVGEGAVMRLAGPAIFRSLG